jgi:hypothetical protein
MPDEGKHNCWCSAVEYVCIAIIIVAIIGGCCYCRKLDVDQDLAQRAARQEKK